MLTFNFVLQKVKAPAKLKAGSMFNILVMDKTGPVLQVKFTQTGVALFWNVKLCVQCME
jgi:hypothetical protein